MLKINKSNGVINLSRKDEFAGVVERVTVTMDQLRLIALNMENRGKHVFSENCHIVVNKDFDIVIVSHDEFTGETGQMSIYNDRDKKVIGQYLKKQEQSETEMPY